jgi:hypothetical protein
MNAAVVYAEAFLAKHPRIKIDAAELIGYELLSADVAPEDTIGRLAIVSMIVDCSGKYGRAIPYHLAEAPTGNLTVWVLPFEPLLQ